MSAFKVGDLVECIRASGPECEGVPLNRGELYTVTESAASLEDRWGGALGPGVRVDKAPTPPHRMWCASRFRLIHRPDAKLIEALKALPADLVREPA